MLLLTAVTMQILEISRLNNSELIVKIENFEPSFHKTLLYPLSNKHYHGVKSFPWPLHILPSLALSDSDLDTLLVFF